MKKLVLIICLSGMIFVVGCSGNIEGTVSSQGIVLNNVEIKTDPVTEIVLTDTSGYYLIEGISQGNYQLTAEATGYIKDYRNVFVIKNETAIADFELIKEQEEVEYELVVVAIYDSPSSAIKDLTWDDSTLWINISGVNGISKCSIDTTISIQESYNWNCNGGITWDGNNIWSGSYFESGYYKIYKHNMDVSLSTATQYTYSSSNPTTKLIWDGSNLWSEWGEKIYKHNMDSTLSIATTYDYLDNYDSYSHYLRGLTFDGSNLWSADDRQTIYKHNMDSNLSVAEIYYVPGTQIWCLTYDGAYLWYFDYNSAKIYKCLRQAK